MNKDSIQIPRWKRILRKSLAVVAAFTIVFNFGGSFVLTANVAQAITDFYTFTLDAPTPPTASDTYTWTLDVVGDPSPEVSHFSLEGCWTEDNIVSVNDSTSWDWSPIDPPLVAQKR